MNRQTLYPVTCVWESVDLNPAVVVIRDFEDLLRLPILHVDVCSLQAGPAIYEVEWPLRRAGDEPPTSRLRPHIRYVDIIRKGLYAKPLNFTVWRTRS